MSKFAEKTITYIQVPLKSLEQIILFSFSKQQKKHNFFFYLAYVQLLQNRSQTLRFLLIWSEKKWVYFVS